MSRTITTEAIRGFLTNVDNSDNFDLIGATEALLAHCDRLDEEPQDYGFEFVADDPNVGNEGVRSVYYAYRYMGDLPEGCTASYYILAPDDGHPDDAAIVRFIGQAYDGRCNEPFADSDDESTCFETMAEVVAWFNTLLGAEIITRLQNTKGQP